MKNKNGTMDELAAADYAKILNSTVAISNLAAVAADGKVKIPGVSPVTGGAMAVVLSGGKSKAVFSTRKIGSDEMEIDFEAEICLSDSPSDMVVDHPSGDKLTLYDLLDLGYRQVDRICEASSRRGEPLVETVTYYERHLASIWLQVINAERKLSEAFEIQNDAYIQGDQIISRDPMGLFEAFGMGSVEQTDVAFVLLDTPFVEVKKVKTEHGLLCHVRLRDTQEAIRRCLQWQ